MDLTLLKFSYDVLNHVMRLHSPDEKKLALPEEISIKNLPILYNKHGKSLVVYYFAHHKEIIKAFCSSLYDSEKLTTHTLCTQAENLIANIYHYHQCYEIFYSLCVKLSLLGLVSMERGTEEALCCVIQKIKEIATDAYGRGNLDEKFDNMYNLSYDILFKAFEWSGCCVHVHWDLTKLDMKPNDINYFARYESYFDNYLNQKGNAVLNQFNTNGSKLKIVKKEVFIYQIQDWCDAYYGQVGHLENTASLSDILDIFMKISLLTVHAVALLYPCSIRFAHESIIKLAISAERNGMFAGKVPEIKSL